MKTLRNYIEAYLFSLPSLFLTIALGIYPIVWAMRYMFYDYPGYGQEVFIGLENFARIGRDEAFWKSVWNTFVYAGGKIILTIPISLVLAVILNRGVRGRHLLRALYFMPTVISTAVISIVFFVIFNSYNGIVNQLLIQAGIVDKGIDWLGKYAMLTVILVAVWGAIGNYMMLFLAGLQSIPEDVYESASLDGANPVQKFWFITIPMLGPVMQMIILLAITVSLKGYESIMVMTEGGPVGRTEVMYLYIYKLFFPIASGGSASYQEIGYGSAVGFVSALIIGAVTLAYFALSKRLNRIY